MRVVAGGKPTSSTVGSRIHAWLSSGPTRVRVEEEGGDRALAIIPTPQGSPQTPLK